MCQLFAAVDLEDYVVGHAQVEEDEPQPEDDMVAEVAEDLHVEEEAEEEAGVGGGGRDAQVPELVHLQARGIGLYSDCSFGRIRIRNFFQAHG